MKIFYTKKFKEVIGKPYKQISLGKYKLRGGFVGFKDITSDNITSGEFLSTASPTSFGEERYYDSQFVNYRGGFQISFEVPEKDASIYSDGYYQVILFYYTEKNVTNLAFIVFEDFQDGFSGLSLNTRRNIITTPQVEYKCDIVFEQSEITRHLENQWGQDSLEVTPLGKDTPQSMYISLDSWKKFWAEELSGEGDTDWIETVFINNFGLRIY